MPMSPNHLGATFEYLWFCARATAATIAEMDGISNIYHLEEKIRRSGY